LPELLMKIARKMPAGIKDRLQPLKHPMDGWLIRRIHSISGNTVAQGPFKGLKYFGYHEVAFLLGTYEKEVFPAIERILEGEYTDIVSIGAASGFYVAGLARRYPKARLYAFETSELHQGYIRENVEANVPGSSLQVYGECRPTDLANVIPQQARTLVVSDVEGAELDLLDPSLAPQLKNSTLLVETHDPLRPGCTQGMLDWFGETHLIERIHSQERTLADFPYPALTRPAFMMANSALRAMSEFRAGPQEWLLMTPKG